ncbi:MAG: endolytic transglycosylase MltG [Thermodesulfobacteriota bacterium]
MKDDEKETIKEPGKEEEAPVAEGGEEPPAPPQPLPPREDKKKTKKREEEAYAEDEAPAPPRLGCFSRLVIVFLILCLLALLGAGVAYLEIRTRLMPVSAEPTKVDVTIPKGAPVLEIGRILEEHKVIRSAEAFRHYVAFKKVGHLLKAGEMVLDSSLGTPQIVEALIKGSFKLYALTIPEGLTMRQIAQKAAEAGFVDQQEFLALCRDRQFITTLGLDVDSLEGYLFPQTYYFPKNVTTREVIKTMVDMFWQVWDRYQSTAKNHKLTRPQIITLASIVEKETAAPEERPLIASVFLNRLEKGMKLETDPTVIYGLENFNGNLTKKDLQTPHPYNTYVIQGLPPGPIASPGEESIKAVLRPAVSDYLFFVSRNDGTHQFSRTLKEHNQAVNKYQRGGGGGE